MVHFPHETLLHIVENIADSSTPRSEVRLHLARLCRTSRAWHAAARAELYSSLTLFIDDDYDTAPDAKLVRTLLLSDEHAAFVRTLTLIWRASDVERTAVVVGFVLQRLVSLEQLAVPVPDMPLNFSGAHIQALKSVNPDLRYLDLYAAPGMSIGVLLARLPHLRRLVLAAPTSFDKREYHGRTVTYPLTTPSFKLQHLAIRYGSRASLELQQLVRSSYESLTTLVMGVDLESSALQLPVLPNLSRLYLTVVWSGSTDHPGHPGDPGIFRGICHLVEQAAPLPALTTLGCVVSREYIVDRLPKVYLPIERLLSSLPPRLHTLDLTFLPLRKADVLSFLADCTSRRPDLRTLRLVSRSWYHRTVDAPEAHRAYIEAVERRAATTDVTIEWTEWKLEWNKTEPWRRSLAQEEKRAIQAAAARAVDE